MDTTTISKYGWIIIVTVIVVLFGAMAPSMADAISDKVIKIVERNNISYSVFLDANGGMVAHNDILVVTGKPYGYLPTPTMEGKTFLGWYTSTTGGEKISSNTIYNGTSDVILYARWTDAN